ncbi:MAG: Rnf-Nqr domain containing protein [Oscillospiraceae bacterium]|nr:Rnf-Nqr domain containing protein [Oscillospiraceae bacterium]
MSASLNGFVSMLALGLAACTLQNAVAARALGVSRLLSLVDDSTSTFIFGLELCSVTLLSTAAHYFLNYYLLSRLPFADYIRPLAIVLCMAVSFFIVFFFVIKLTPIKKVDMAVNLMPPAAFSVPSFATILLTSSNRYGLISSLVYALGSSIGYVIAVALVTEGQRKLKNSAIPLSFKGLPVTLLYLAGLALGIYGLSGYTFVF